MVAFESSEVDLDNACAYVTLKPQLMQSWGTTLLFAAVVGCSSSGSGGAGGSHSTGTGATGAPGGSGIGGFPDPDGECALATTQDACPPASHCAWKLPLLAPSIESCDIVEGTPECLSATNVFDGSNSDHGPGCASAWIYYGPLPDGTIRLIWYKTAPLVVPDAALWTRCDMDGPPVCQCACEMDL